MKFVEIIILNFLLLLVFITNLNINFHKQEVTLSLRSFSKSDFVTFSIFIFIILISHFTKISKRIQSWILKHYVFLFYFFMFIAGYYFFCLIFKNDFLSIGFSWSIIILCIYFYYLFYNPHSKLFLIINNLFVIVFTIFLTSVFLTLLPNFILYFIFLTILGIWDIYSVIKTKFMQELASRYTLKVPTCIIISEDHRKVAIGNGDLLFLNIFPCIVYLYEKSLIMFTIVYFLEVIGCYIFIKLIIEKIKEPQPFIPYLTFIQSLVFLFITLFNLVK